MLEKLLENMKALQNLLSTMLSAFIYPTVMYPKICTVFVVLLLLSIGEGNSDPTSPQWGMSYIKVREVKVLNKCIVLGVLVCGIAEYFYEL